MIETIEDLFLLDKIWMSKIFSTARETGLDWLRMCAAANVLSNGDPRARVIDWEFIEEKLGPDNPVFASWWFNDKPAIQIIDRGTKWGLFQIHGDMALKFGYTGKL